MHTIRPSGGDRQNSRLAVIPGHTFAETVLPCYGGLPNYSPRSFLPRLLHSFSSGFTRGRTQREKKVTVKAWSSVEHRSTGGWVCHATLPLLTYCPPLTPVRTKHCPPRALPCPFPNKRRYSQAARDPMRRYSHLRHTANPRPTSEQKCGADDSPDHRAAGIARFPSRPRTRRSCRRLVRTRKETSSNILPLKCVQRPPRGIPSRSAGCNRRLDDPIYGPLRTTANDPILKRVLQLRHTGTRRMRQRGS
jgi:hypothetical protein